MAKLRLRVPPPFVDALRWLAHTDRFEDLARVVGAPDDRALSVVLGALGEVDDRGQALQALRALRELREFARSHGSSLEEVADALLADPTLELEEKEQTAFRERVLSALDWPLLARLNAAVDLASAHARNYAQSRIISDIRPLFGEDVGTRPTEAVVVHTLQVDFWEDNSYRSLFVALDSEDLQRLAAVVERALVKDQTLGALLSDANLRRLGRETGLGE